jgi:hypothetical protein
VLEETVVHRLVLNRSHGAVGLSFYCRSTLVLLAWALLALWRPPRSGPCSRRRGPEWRGRMCAAVTAAAPSASGGRGLAGFAVAGSRPSDCSVRICCAGPRSGVSRTSRPSRSCSADIGGWTALLAVLIGLLLSRPMSSVLARRPAVTSSRRR